MSHVIFRGLLVLIALAACRTSHAALTVDWNGPTWTARYNNTSLELSGSDLIVSATPDANGRAAGHFNTDPAFRNSLTPWIEFSFNDTLGGVRKHISIEDEDTSTPGGRGGWLMFGVFESSTNYQVYYNDYDADFGDNSDVDFSVGQVLDTGVNRTADDHIFRISRNLDGSIDFLIDGALTKTLSGGEFNPDFFGDVYLESQGQDTTFTSFAFGNNDATTTPEPASLAIWSVLGLVSAGATWRKKRRSAA